MEDSRYGSVRYFSASKKEFIKVEDLHSSHLLNVWKKETKAREQNDPQLPDDLWNAICAEIKERKLDQPYETGTKL